MESNYHNRDFERFLKQNADQYRMFPSERVWKNIHYNLHQRNRWYGLAVVLFLLTTATVTGVMLIPSNRKIQLADSLPSASAKLPIPEATVANNSPTEKTNTKRVTISTTETSFTSGNLYLSEPANSEQPPAEEIAVAEQLAPPSIAAIRLSVTNVPTIVNTEVTLADLQPKPLIPSRKAVVIEPPFQENGQTEVAVNISPVATDELQPANPEENPAGKETATADNEKSAELIEKSANLQPPLTIESVVNSFVRKKNRFTLQAYFTPTISYRRLKEDNQFLSETQSRATPSNSLVAISDVENSVTHKPDLGLQLGVNAGYSLSPRLTFITGLQFNVNKYDIRAYNYPAERGTIALMSSPYNTSVERETTYRNYSGGRKADWLHNLYFSASIPIGLQFRLSGAGKTEIGIGGSLQPTYLLGNQTYLLTTDYKNYIEVPSLIRRWNVTSSFEVFAGVSTGKVDWRIGPQVRYQLFSSYKPEYPVKEHLFDFGLKVGIILNK